MSEHYLQDELYRLVEADAGIFRWIQESCLDGITLRDLDREDQQWTSPQLKALLGYQDHEVEDHHGWWQQQIVAEDQAALAEALRGHLEHGLPYNQVVRFRHRNGGTLWLRCRALALRDPDGHPTRLLGVQTDVTAMLQSDSAAEVARGLAKEKDTLLARTQEQLEYALRSADLGLWDWAITSGGELLSDTWLDLLGMNRDQATGSVRDWFDRIHPADGDRVQAQLQAHFSGEAERFEARYRIRHEDGSWRWMETNGQVVERDEAGEPLRMVGIMADITARVAIEDAVRESKERAEQATRAKSEFLATMSHEIRTPLNGVLGMTEVLLKTTLRDEQRDYAETIRTSGQLLLTVINDILDFAKVEAGKLELEVKAFDPRALLDEVVALFSAEARRKQLELAAIVAPDVPPALLGDETRVRQILINLLSNAIKFTEQGEVTIRIDAAEGAIDLKVKDTGIGMSETVRQAIFKPFVQAESSTTRRFGGTGLGLSIIERLIALMGGSIRVESQEGVGTTMHVQLPLAGTTLAPAQHRDLSLLAGKRVLHADDNLVNRQVLAELAESWGVEVVNCEDAIHALRHLRRADQRFDCLVTDLHMPDIDGLMLARLIASDPTIPKTPIVMFTSVTTATVYQQSRSLGICGVITKPIRQGKLMEALLQAFGAPGSSPGASEPRRDGRPHVARALLAEDNEINQRLLELQLKDLIGELVIAEDGMMAVERAREGHFDLILMDCQMPMMDGFAACLAIRAEEAAEGRTPVPIIALTANVMPGDRQRCLDVGMDDYLSKPVRLEDLQRVVAKWCMASGEASESSEASEGKLRPPSSAAIEVLQQSVGEHGLRELVSVSIRTFGRLRAAARTALESSDLPALARATHSVKGAASGLGLSELTAQSHALNLAARDARGADCRILFTSWDACIAAGIDLLGSLQQDGGALNGEETGA